jgi:hypothetical protein
MTTRPASARRRLTRLQRSVVAAVLLLLGLGALLYSKAEQIVLGAEGYIFGFPLVVMDVTRANAVLAIGPQNQLRRVRQFPDARFRDVVRPNVDTLYTTAFMDMAQGPWAFEMAANDQRYEVMPFMDAWTNVFASPGTRVSGPGGGSYLLAAPGWQGEVPTGMTLLRAPTRMVWLIGRTQTNGAADYATVHKLQDGLTLRSLADVQAGRTGDAAARATPPPVQPGAAPPPIVQMRAMDVSTFFTRLSLLMVDNPPTAADAPMLAKLARLGVAPGQPPQWGVPDRWAVGLGRWVADRTVARELDKRPTIRGWITPPGNLGNYGTAYNIRAVVAMIGLGANLNADATYPSASVDTQGKPLDGSKRYRLHFDKGMLPPVKAFWSITAYGADDFFIDNPLNRYALGDRDPLVYNPDGSLDLLVQAEAPPADRRNNWLPVRSGQPFVLNARLYWPQPAALDGRWGMPGIEPMP